MTDAIRQRKGFAMGQKTPGYGHYTSTSSGRNPGFAAGGSVSKRVPTAGHHNMDGHIGKGSRGQTHKSHGHTEGVPYQKTGGVGGGVGAPTGPKQSGAAGPSNSQFGGGMPSVGGSSLKRW